MAVLDALHVARVIVVGHSMGAFVYTIVLTPAGAADVAARVTAELAL